MSLSSQEPILWISRLMGSTDQSSQPSSWSSLLWQITVVDIPAGLSFIPFLCRIIAFLLAAPFALCIALDIIAYAIARTLHLSMLSQRIPRSPPVSPNSLLASGEEVASSAYEDIDDASPSSSSFQHQLPHQAATDARPPLPSGLLTSSSTSSLLSLSSTSTSSSDISGSSLSHNASLGPALGDRAAALSDQTHIRHRLSKVPSEAQLKAQ